MLKDFCLLNQNWHPRFYRLFCNQVENYSLELDVNVIDG